MEVGDFYGLKPYISFFDESNMPAVARLIVSDTSMGIPMGIYAFIEFFCVDPDCDCRKTSIQVIDEASKTVMASIHYGWESEEYYTDLFGEDKYANPKEGLSLEPMQQQSKYSNKFLDIFEMKLNSNEEYRMSIEERYFDVKFRVKEIINALEEKKQAKAIPSFRKKRFRTR